MIFPKKKKKKKEKILNTLKKVKKIYQDDFLSPPYMGRKKITTLIPIYVKANKNPKDDFYFKKASSQIYTNDYGHRCVLYFLCSSLVMGEEMAKLGGKVRLESICLSEPTSPSSLCGDRNQSIIINNCSIHLHSFLSLKISMILTSLMV